MIHAKLSILVPVVVLGLVFISVRAQGNNSTSNTSAASTTANPTSTTGKASNVSTSPPASPSHNRTTVSSNTTSVTTQTHGQYPSLHFGGMVKRLFIVTAVLSLIVGFYFVLKICRSGKRKARKYGVVKTPGDLEMRPLESDDDDEDEDVTMFNRKN